MANIAMLLEEAGSSLEDIVKVTGVSRRPPLSRTGVPGDGTLAQGRLPGVHRARGLRSGPARVACRDRRHRGDLEPGRTRDVLASARDGTGAFGMVICSSSPAVASRCVHLRAGVGARRQPERDQSTPRRSSLHDAASGRSVGRGRAQHRDRGPDAPSRLPATHRRRRPGRTAVHTGRTGAGDHHHRADEDAAAAGNMLRDERVIDVVARLQTRPACLDVRLLDGLAAAIVAGGEAGPCTPPVCRWSRTCLGRSPTCGSTGTTTRSANCADCGRCGNRRRRTTHPRAGSHRRTLVRRAGGPVSPTLEDAIDGLRDRATDANAQAVPRSARRIPRSPGRRWILRAGSPVTRRRRVHRGASTTRAWRRRSSRAVGSGPLHLAVCAEYDALPGIGHACGHNVIAAITVGAAGAAPFVDDLGITRRCSARPPRRAVAARSRCSTAACSRGATRPRWCTRRRSTWRGPNRTRCRHSHITYDGKAAHAAAYPDRGINAADAFTIAQVAIGLLRQQFPHDVRVHGIDDQRGRGAQRHPATHRGPLVRPRRDPWPSWPRSRSGSTAASRPAHSPPAAS